MQFGSECQITNCVAAALTVHHGKSDGQCYLLNGTVLQMTIKLNVARQNKSSSLSLPLRHLDHASWCLRYNAGFYSIKLQFQTWQFLPQKADCQLYQFWFNCSFCQWFIFLEGILLYFWIFSCRGHWLVRNLKQWPLVLWITCISMWHIRRVRVGWAALHLWCSLSSMCSVRQMDRSSARCSVESAPYHMQSRRVGVAHV